MNSPAVIYQCGAVVLSIRLTFEIPTSELVYCHNDYKRRSDAYNFVVWVDADSTADLEGYLQSGDSRYFDEKELHYGDDDK